MSVEIDPIAQENAQAVVDEAVNEVAAESNVVADSAQEQDSAPAPAPEMPFDEKLTNARSQFDTADTALERGEGGVAEVMQSIENAETRLATLRENLNTKVSDRDVMKQAAMDASEGVEALHREYRRSLG